jgi:tetratricopeptide (TPR) repeat protein
MYDEPTDDDWQYDDLVMSLVERAMELPALERESFLWSACLGDERLYKESWQRARQEELMGSFLQQPVLSSEDEGHALPLGQVLAGQFEIVSLIGEGGMAWVYKGFDRLSGRKVAIKQPKPTFSGRLLPETDVSLEVTHDNVCRVHAIHRATINDGEIEFLTMEFLDGKTLRERLNSGEHISLQEAESIALQLCAGLAAIHRKGVVHGDLKPNNVMLTRTADDQLRVVITDFGLARRILVSDSRPAGSALRGTPGYIAPELFNGVSKSVSSDLYALAVILHEVLGGRPLPNEPASITSTGAQVFKLPRPVRKRWKNVILRCVDPNPAARPRSAVAVLEALEGKWRRPRIVATAAAAVASCVWVGWLFASMFFPSPDTFRLAILPFETDSASAPLVHGIAQEVSERLARVQRGGRGLSIIPPKEAAKNLVPALSTRAALGATHTLTAEFHQAAGKLAAHATLRDTRTSQIVRDFVAEYGPAEVGLLAKALMATVTAGLRLEGVAIPETVRPEAYTDYAQGINYVNDDAPLAERAIPFFERAAQLDRDSPLPYAGMVEADVLMFETSHDRRWIDRAEDTLKNAESRNPDTASVRLAAGSVKQCKGQLEKALDDFRRALQLEPANPDVLRRLADNYGRMGLADEAVATYRRAIAARKDFYGPYNDLGTFYYYRGDYKEAVAQFEEVTALVPALAQGHSNLAAAYTKLGRFGKGEAEIRKALRLREDRDTLANLGAVLAYERRFRESAYYYQRAAAAGLQTPLVLSNLADSYRRLERISEAQRMYARALQVTDQELVQDPSNGPARAFAGYLSARLGDKARADL